MHAVRSPRAKIRCAALTAFATFLVATALAEQPGAQYPPLTDADVRRVVTTLGALIDAAEAGNTAAQSGAIEQRGFAAEFLWNIESAVAAIDQAGPAQSSTVHRLLVANGFNVGADEVLLMWRHYANRVLRADDVIRLVPSSRNLEIEWQELERRIRADGRDLHADAYAELDYITRQALYTSGDRKQVLPYTDALDELRARVAGWPRR